MCSCGSNSTISTSDIPESYKGAINYLFPAATTQAQQGYTAYPNARVADFSSDQQNAFNAVRGLQGVYQPALDAGMASTALGAQQMPNVDMAAYINPYQQNVTDIAKREAIRQDDIARQGRDANAVAAGAFGGDRQALIEAEAGRNLQQHLSDIQMMGGLQAWQQAQAALDSDRKAGIAAGQNYGNLAGLSQSLPLSYAAALENIGSTEQGQAQKNLDVGYQNFQEQRAWPQQKLGWLSNVIRGQNLPTTTTTTAPNPSIVGQVGGLGLTAASLIGGTGGFGKTGWATEAMKSWFGKKGGLVSLQGFKRGGQVGLSTMLPRRERQAMNGEPMMPYFYKARGGLVTLADGGFASPWRGYSNPELSYMRDTWRRSGDSRWQEVDQELERRKGVNRPFTQSPNAVPFNEWRTSPPRKSEFGLEKVLTPDRSVAESPVNRYGDVPTQPMVGPPAPEVAATLPSLRPPAPRPTGLEGTPAAQQSPGALGGIPEDDYRQTPPTSIPTLSEDDLRSLPPTTASPQSEGFWDKASYPMLVAGLRMMAAKPGENFLGAAGAGGLEAVKAMQEKRLLDTRERLAGVEEKKAALTERDITRKEAEDAATIKYKNRTADIEERLNSGKLTLYDAEAEKARATAEYYRSVKGVEAQDRIAMREEQLRQRRNADAAAYDRGLRGQLFKDEMLMTPAEKSQAEAKIQEQIIQAHPKSELARGYLISQAAGAKARVMASKLTEEEKQTRIKAIEDDLAKRIAD